MFRCCSSWIQCLQAKCRRSQRLETRVWPRRQRENLIRITASTVTSYLQAFKAPVPHKHNLSQSPDTPSSLTSQRLFCWHTSGLCTHLCDFDTKLLFDPWSLSAKALRFPAFMLDSCRRWYFYVSIHEVYMFLLELCWLSSVISNLGLKLEHHVGSTGIFTVFGWYTY